MSLPSGPPRDHTRLQDKVVVVTGASKGIGRAIAVGVAEHGADVVIAYRSDRVGAEVTADRIRSLGRTAFMLPVDVSNPSHVRALMDATREEFGVIDVLVNNAALTGWSPALEVTEELWDAVINTNLKGTFFCAIEAARAMNAGGAIVNISSNIAALGVVNLSCYAASKGGVHAMTRQLAVELAPRRIRMNTLAPGPTLVERNLMDEPNYDAVWGDVVPLGRAAAPEEFVEPVVFLASGDSRYITGQLLYVDGGWSIAGRIPPGHLDRVAHQQHPASSVA